MSANDDFVYQGVELGIFEIDDRGRIWRLARQQTSRWGGETKIVKCRRRRAERLNKRHGYLQVALMLAGVRKITGAHRLVWHHFKGSIPDGLTINHEDGKKKRNVPDNLTLATHREQTLHAIHVLGWKSYRNMLGKNSQPGERNAMCKITRRAVHAIRSAKKVRGSSARLARKYGISPAHVSRIRNNQMWTHL